MDKYKLWGGVFTETPHELAWSFGQSIATDSVLWREEIEVSIAHAKMLVATQIIEDGSAIIAELESMLADPGWLEKHVGAEDIHAAVEAELETRIGEDAKRLTAARSRNDQIATVTRLWVMRRSDEANEAIQKVQETILNLTEKHGLDCMPGYTHMQPAQPITLGYHLLAYFWMLQRDWERFTEVRKSTASSCPLGSGALAGTSLPIDREITARALGFETPSPSALDSVSDRDFVGDALHACALLMQHLSRLSQELILWSTAEYGFVRIADAYSTGSSLMPQKRNPDMAELIRGRSSRCIGNWTAFMSMMRGLPLAYNRDMQDDKPPLFDSMKACIDTLALTNGMLSTATFNMARMKDAAKRGSPTATALAEYLVERGMPFRGAHEEAGRIALECEQRGWNLALMDLQQLQELTDHASEELLGRLTIEGDIASKVSAGGPSAAAMAKQTAAAKEALESP